MGLLKGIDPLLTADLLHVLRSMGHGNKICVCDCNFPAAQISTKTVSQKHIILTVPSLPDVLQAICSVLPLDYFEDTQAFHMSPQEGVQLPVEGVEVIDACKATIRDACAEARIRPIERAAFYREAETCFAIVQTLERRPYGNFILTKGCVGPDGSDLRPS